MTTRRRFLQQAGFLAGICSSSSFGTLARGAPPAASPAGEDQAASQPKPLFRISLAEWSLHRALQAGQIDHLDFAKIARQEFDLRAVEYVNQFFMDKANDAEYLAEMKKRAEDQGVRSLLIMIDNEGQLGDPDTAKRREAVERHFKWVEAAKVLGCHSIRVNAASEGSYDEQMKLATDGLRQLSEFAARHDMNVIVENHGGLSSNGKWLASVIQAVELKNCGTLPDFGNFHDYDRYTGVAETMPFAKAVSAKSHAFDAEGNETRTDYFKMMKIVLDAGYDGWVGIEYEGSELDEYAGIRATKELLNRVQQQFREQASSNSPGQ